MEHPIKMDDLGVPLFSESSHIDNWVVFHPRYNLNNQVFCSLLTWEPSKNIYIHSHRWCLQDFFHLSNPMCPSRWLCGLQTTQEKITSKTSLQISKQQSTWNNTPFMLRILEHNNQVWTMKPSGCLFGVFRAIPWAKHTTTFMAIKQPIT